jgi:hypothetical protein
VRYRERVSSDRMTQVKFEIAAVVCEDWVAVEDKEKSC